MTTPLLSVSGLRVGFEAPDGELVEVVSGVDVELEPGHILGIVGESGSGKSTTVAAIAGLLADNGRVTAGEVHLGGVEVNARSVKAMRGRDIGYVFQDPMSHLDPVCRIETMFRRILRADARAAGRKRPSRAECRERAIAALDEVGIRSPETVVRTYPHELSGGMAQRVMIAFALVRHPQLLIADEPTTALDVTVQAQVLALLKDLRDRLGLSIVLITHNIGVVAETCDDIIVMRHGVIVERGAVGQVLIQPQHEYTRVLLDAQPGRLAEHLNPAAFAHAGDTTGENA